MALLDYHGHLNVEAPHLTIQTDPKMTSYIETFACIGLGLHLK